MLTIKEICEQADISLHTFQFWRRHGSQLLPEPVAVKKRVIYFDDSILERIKFIRDQQTAGKSLAEIQTMLGVGKSSSSVYTATPDMLQARIIDKENQIDEIQDYAKKWQEREGRGCIKEVCEALGLDPAISGAPVVYLLSEIGPVLDNICALRAYVTIASNGVVHFAELALDVYKKPQVMQRDSIAAEDYGMLMNMFFQAFVNSSNCIMGAEYFSYLLFDGTADENGRDFWKKAITRAKELNRLVEAGREAIKFFKEHVK